METKPTIFNKPENVKPPAETFKPQGEETSSQPQPKSAELKAAESKPEVEKVNQNTAEVNVSSEDREKIREKIKSDPEDNMDKVMQKISAAKEEFRKAEEEVARLENELNAARDFRTTMFNDYAGLKEQLGHFLDKDFKR